MNKGDQMRELMGLLPYYVEFPENIHCHLREMTMLVLNEAHEDESLKDCARRLAGLFEHGGNRINDRELQNCSTVLSLLAINIL